MPDSIHLHGPRAKFERAKHHFSALCASVAPVGQTSSDLFTGDADSPIGNKVTASIPVEWSLIIGDCVHNLRSALDHLIWEAVIFNGTQPDRHTCFPIYSRSDRLPDGLDGKIEGTSQKVRDVIYELNPCKPGNPNLCLLHDLDIADKHKTLAVVRATIEERTSLLKVAEGTHTQLATGELPAVIRPEENIELLSTSDTTPDQYVEASVQIKFGEGHAKDALVVPTLGTLVETTNKVIEKFGEEVFLERP